jgi:NSS family neurotransmitter:Na+ symporter
MTTDGDGPNTDSGRELFTSRIGFVLAAVGSAVGLGNMWRFPYQTAESGGAAFVVLYIVMTILLGVPIITAEFIVGRRTRRSPIGAVREIGGRAWTPLGLFYVISPLIICGYFSVISGWTLRYALDALSGFSTDAAQRYEQVSSGVPAITYHLVLMAVVIGVVSLGIRKGIERAALVLMPILFVLLIGLAVWAGTLPGSGAGYSFYLRPSWGEILNPTVIKQAASHAFLSLSVGMGVMLTYSSYLSRRQNLSREAATVAISDFSVAFIGGLVVFPVIFALGLSNQVGESTMGALFVSIPAAFVEMGSVGRIVGFMFFAALVVAALTSSFSLLEVVTASLMDQLKISRGSAAVTAGIAAAAIGIVPAMSQDALGILDKVVGELFVVIGALGMSVLVGWVMKDPLSELLEGASPPFRRAAPKIMFTLRWVVPVMVAIVLWFSAKDTIALFTG